MIPLVKVSLYSLSRLNVLTDTTYKMHDLVTQDLAVRVGGSRAGLLNASLVRPFSLDRLHPTD